MAAPLRPHSAPLNPRPEPGLVDRLFAEGSGFDFFQAVRLLAQLYPEHRPPGHAGLPAEEFVRFRALPSLSFPASAIATLDPPTAEDPAVAMAVTFLGLTGPSGTLPRFYTQTILRKLQYGRSPEERHALRDWLDLFNHRLLALFYRAWEKYRFHVPYERGEFADPFTLGLFSLIGLGTPALRQRLHVTAGGMELARLDDLGLLRFGGLLAHRPRNAVSLEALLRGTLRMPVQVLQFQGQWLALEADNQSTLAAADRNNCLGRNVIVGDRLWDVQGKIRIQLGPLAYEQFVEFLPDRTPTSARKAIFLVAQLVRLYVGPEVDVEIQPLLQAAAVPKCQLGNAGGLGARLGWNTWSHRRPLPHDAADAVFRVSDEGSFEAEQGVEAAR